MKIIYEKPPIFDRALKAFGPIVNGAIFCYGELIYIPSGMEISPHLLAHEKVHSNQQRLIGVDKWWDQYLSDPMFRLVQEFSAHCAEYHSFCQTPQTRIQRRLYLKGIAQRLAGPLYGSVITFAQAKQAIKLGAKDGRSNSDEQGI